MSLCPSAWNKSRCWQTNSCRCPPSRPAFAVNDIYRLCQPRFLSLGCSELHHCTMDLTTFYLRKTSHMLELQSCVCTHQLISSVMPSYSRIMWISSHPRGSKNIIGRGWGGGVVSQPTLTFSCSITLLAPNLLTYLLRATPGMLSPPF